VLKKTRWCVLKRKANLTSEQRFRLRDLLRYNPKTVRAYLLKEDFQQRSHHRRQSRWRDRYAVRCGLPGAHPHAFLSLLIET
jgi:transposase